MTDVMPPSAQPPSVEPGVSLDQMVDDVLAANPMQSDWTAAAQLLPQGLVAAGVAAGTGDAFSRLFGTDFGQRAVRSVGNESRTLSSVGMLAANVLGRMMDRGGAAAMFGRPLPPEARRMIIFHGQGGLRRSILVLDPTLDPSTPAAVAPSQWIGQLARQAKGLLESHEVGGELAAQSDEDALDALWIARPRVVVAPAPTLIDTCVMRPAGKVVCGKDSSTAGAYVRNAGGDAGVTVCYHGTGPKGTALTIDGVARAVSLASEALDTCFVPIPEAEIPKAQLGLGRKGLLRKRAPGGQERHTFWAASGEAKEARIVGADFGVPIATPRRQLCVYTNAVTNYGDSGGALINDDDELVGFCFQRTPGGSPMDFSTWVWADSALLELGLQPYQ